MSLRELIERNRSYRRFVEDARIDKAALRDLVDLARLSASAGNKQPLKFMLACEPDLNARIFPHLAWAAYLQSQGAPPAGERPAAYVIILGDTTLSAAFGSDHGIAAQSILLGAVEQGWGGCMIGAIERDGLRSALAIPARFEILLVLALGRPKETVVIESVSEGSVRYWRDADSRHHVPKRSLDELLVGPFVA